MNLSDFEALKNLPLVEKLNRRFRHDNISNSVSFGKNVEYSSEAKVEEGTNLGDNVKLKGPVEIGKYCAVASNVVLQATDHDYSSPVIQAGRFIDLTGNQLPTVKSEIKVGNDVWIGRKTLILKGVEIGSGAVIGAGSVVTSDVQPCEIVAGNPAEHIGWRFSSVEERERYLGFQWWEKDRRTQLQFLQDWLRGENQP